MSASKKLKMWQREMFEGERPLDRVDAEGRILDALPQIVAAVFAAENGEICGCCRSPTWKHSKDCPLVALEEALS